MLRTYRRAAGRKRQAESECQHGGVRACARSKHQKMKVQTFQARSRTSKNRPQSDRKRKKITKMANKRPTCAHEAAKNEKKVPENENCANIVPTYGSFGLDSGGGAPH